MSGHGFSSVSIVSSIMDLVEAKKKKREPGGRFPVPHRPAAACSRDPPRSAQMPPASSGVRCSSRHARGIRWHARFASPHQRASLTGGRFSCRRLPPRPRAGRSRCSLFCWRLLQDSPLLECCPCVHLSAIMCEHCEEEYEDHK